MIFPPSGVITSNLAEVYGIEIDGCKKDNGESMGLMTSSDFAFNKLRNFLHEGHSVLKRPYREGMLDGDVYLGFNRVIP